MAVLTNNSNKSFNNLFASISGGNKLFGQQTQQQTQQPTFNQQTQQPTFSQQTQQPTNNFGFGQQTQPTNNVPFGQQTPQPTNNVHFGQQTQPITKTPKFGLFSEFPAART